MCAWTYAYINWKENFWGGLRGTHLLVLRTCSWFCAGLGGPYRVTGLNPGRLCAGQKCSLLYYRSSTRMRNFYPSFPLLLADIVAVNGRHPQVWLCVCSIGHWACLGILGSIIFSGSIRVLLGSTLVVQPPALERYGG